ncbi:MAG: hypothetical protein ACI89J_000687 [Hyphomicrobiaceae bacterium]|jgi:hypothetical protein
MRVFSLNQIDLPLAWPLLHGFLFLYCILHIAEHYKPDQLGHTITFRELAAFTGAVLRDTCDETIRYANVEGAVWSACQYVKCSRCSYGLRVNDTYPLQLISYYSRENLRCHPGARHRGLFLGNSCADRCARRCAFATLTPAVRWVPATSAGMTPLFVANSQYPYFPLNTGLRFSLKARTPSRRSSVLMTAP